MRFRPVGNLSRSLVGSFTRSLTVDGHVHHHVLIAGTESLFSRTLREAWRGGVSNAKGYDPARGAAHYVSKHYCKDELVEWDVSHRMPTKRLRLDA